MIKRLICILFAVLSVISFCSCSGSDSFISFDQHGLSLSASKAPSKIINAVEEMRGVWIASVYNINFPSSPDLSEKALKAELDQIVDFAKENRMNTVFFQVHPASDALYRSDIFPVSRYLYTDGILHFDPLEYMSKICNENGISIYAWVNPLRVSVNESDTEEEARNKLPVGSPGFDRDLTVFYGDGKLYLDCGRKAVRDLVSKCVTEIVSGYDIDGIVFDDYFYPYPVNDPSGKVYEFDDTDSYKTSKTSLSRDDWRRENVNSMIRECYTEIKKIDPDVQFGVAPFGIWQNNNGSNGGSFTSGMEAYSELYCDAVSWIKGKYVDFISPQLYWTIDSTTAPYGELVKFWNSVTDGTGVDLIVSHGIYLYDTWNDPSGELVKQVELSRNFISYRGSIMYGYEALTNNTNGVTDDMLSAFDNKTYYYHPSSYDEGIIIDTLNDVNASGSKVTFEGYSDPANPLTVNGVSVSRSHSGYFKCILDLAVGDNEFVFKCGEIEKTVYVIKNS